MFQQLSPLLSTRSLVLTAALVEGGLIRVTVTPRSTGKDDPKELSQPFAVEGTAEELDNELPAAIAAYTTEHMSLARSLEVIKNNMDAALKAAKSEADKKVAEARKTAKPGAPAPKAVEPPAVKPSEPSLFDPPSDPPAEQTVLQPVPAIPQPPAATTAPPQSSMFDTNDDEEDEILKEAFFGPEDDRIAA